MTPDKTDFSYKGGGKQIEDPAGKHSFYKVFLSVQTGTYPAF